MCACVLCLYQVRAGDDVYLVGVANERFLVSSLLILLELYFDL